MSDTPNPDDKGPVPYERFAETRRELATAKEAAAAAAAALTAATEAAILAAREAVEARARATSHATALERFRAAVGVGLTDPEVVDAAVWAYERQPAEGRPAFGEALSAWRADPSKAPAVLRPWFAGAGSTPPPAAPPAPPAPPAPGRDPAPPAGSSPAPPAYTPEAISRLIAEGKYGEHRVAIAQALAGAAQRR